MSVLQIDFAIQKEIGKHLGPEKGGKCQELGLQIVVWYYIYMTV